MAPKVDGYRFGKVVIDGVPYTKDVIIFPDRVRSDWWRTKGHSLVMDDLVEIMEAKPQILVVGLGAFGRMEIPERTRHAIEAEGIELISAATEQACQAYNEARDEGIVIAALHLTC